MAYSGDFYSTQEAARLLGVSQRRVQQMVDSGELTRVARGLVAATSVERHRAVAKGARTRAWAEHTAWGAIALLSDMPAAWLGPAQTSRLRSALREISDPAVLVARTRDRAVVHTYAGHSSALNRMQQDLAIIGAPGLGLVGTRADQVDGYLPAVELESTVRWLGIVEDPAGAITVRATNFDIAIVRELAADSSLVLAALDATTSLDPRERGVGERALVDALGRYHR